MVVPMLKPLLERIAVFLDPGPDLHAGDDSHAMDDEDGEEEW
jgi:hypothetical protein